MENNNTDQDNHKSFITRGTFHTKESFILDCFLNLLSYDILYCSAITTTLHILNESIHIRIIVHLYKFHTTMKCSFVLYIRRKGIILFKVILIHHSSLIKMLEFCNKRGTQHFVWPPRIYSCLYNKMTLITARLESLISPV